jgi:ubiquinone/menaquinone biosynthesis C-methylase UbiE
MSKIGETLLIALNDLMPDMHSSLLEAKQDSFSYQRFFAARSKSSFSLFGQLDFEEKNVLDVGCGLGANLVHICDLGAKSVTGLDLSLDQARCTQKMMEIHHPELAGKIRFVAADAAWMPFADSYFDALVAADTFEHIDNLEPALAECARVLKPGGYLYAYFPPFFAPWGAHMVNWIRLPWCQIFFSEQTILNVARKLEANNKSINSQLPQETRLDLGSGNIIPFVSHLTIQRFKHAVVRIKNWKIVKEELLPPNWRTKSLRNKLLQPINNIPYIQEMFTAKAVFVIRKNDIR